MFQDSRGYWYKTRRVEGRVVRDYVGHGAACEATAQLDRRDRQFRNEHQASTLLQREQLLALDHVVQGACAAAATVMRAQLESQGYRQHARGQWRKRRTSIQSEADDMEATTKETTANDTRETETSVNEKSMVKASGKPTDLATMPPRELMKRALSGDQAAARAYFDSVKDPEAQMAMVNVIADYGRRAREQMLSFCSDRPTAISIEATDRKLQAIRDELCGSSPSPLERLLVERILSCWLQVHQIERAMHSQQDFHNVEFLDKCLERAHKRYLHSIKALAQVRKLQLPDVQVNIGEKQVNIARMNGAPPNGAPPTL